MEGVGTPLVTPFDESGDVDHGRLADLVDWVEARNVDFLVPCGSTSEAELLTADERRRVVETVVDAASVPVVAGTGHPGIRETMETTEAAAEAGADAALVVTPFYYFHDQDALVDYYSDVADASPLPVYLYSVPKFTGVGLDPETVERLADHSNVTGMKDSSGDVGTLVRTHNRVADADFEMLVGGGSVLAQGLDVGAAGGVLAVSNVAPEASTAIADTHPDDPVRARELNADLVDLNHAVTAEYGVPGLKWAMRERGAPAGRPRSPHQWPDEAARDRLEALVADL